jgi:hypothetical protein
MNYKALPSKVETGPGASERQGTSIIGYSDGTVNVALDGTDVIQTGKAQAKWNRLAALFACAAAAFQALQSAIGLFTYCQTYGMIDGQPRP